MSGFVYFVQAVDGGPIKIGFSTDPQARLRSLQTANPARLRFLALLPGTEADEAALHAACSHDRLAGEWFNDTEDVRAFAIVRPAVPQHWCDDAARAIAAIRDDLLRAQDGFHTRDNSKAVDSLLRAGTRVHDLCRSLSGTENAQAAA